MEFFEDFLDVLKAFQKEKLEYILIGGFAVIIHGMPRVTQDLDIFVKMVPENIEKLRIATMETLYWLKKDTIRPEDRRDASFLGALMEQRKKSKKSKKKK